MSEPYIVQNSFSVYRLTDDEILQGSIFTTLQKQVIQNLLATNAEEKLRITFDPQKPMEFAQAEAEKRGVIDILQYLLDASVAAEETLNQAAITIED